MIRKYFRKYFRTKVWTLSYLRTKVRKYIYLRRYSTYLHMEVSISVLHLYETKVHCTFVQYLRGAVSRHEGNKYFEKTCLVHVVKTHYKVSPE
jgi:hypothetical protein